MPKGQRFGGRQKGTPNKNTAAIKDMILQALTNAGGVKYLQKQANENPGPFMALLGKILPTEVTGAGGGPLKIERIERVIVDAANRDPARLPPAP